MRATDLIKVVLAVVVLSLSIAAPAAAGPLDDALAAYNRGDYAAALRLVRPLAEQGDPQAQASLGEMYDSGQGVPQDYSQALKWSRLAAAQGEAVAQNNLGSMYINGHGVPRDDVAAAKWYRKGADQGLAESQFNLGAMYYNGQGVPKDYVMAVMWYRKSADQDYSPAQLNLGLMYVNGQGVRPDYVQAHMWLNLAATGFPASDKEGSGEATKDRDLLAARMTPEQIAEAQKLASEWKPIVTADTLTNNQVRQAMISESIASYQGHCPCPYNAAANGSQCGKRSAWSKAGGYAPLCYPTDISDEMVKAYRAQHGLGQ